MALNTLIEGLKEAIVVAKRCETFDEIIEKLEKQLKSREDEEERLQKLWKSNATII